jgi:serine/threonine protein phosphatase PrpC
MIEDGAIKDGLSEPAPDAAAWKLVDLANAAGGQDNITVIVADAVG